MDAGWHSTLADGLQVEVEASRLHSQTEVTPEKVAARRAGIQSRGRDQSKG